MVQQELDQNLLKKYFFTKMAVDPIMPNMPRCRLGKVSNIFYFNTHPEDLGCRCVTSFDPF